MTWSLICAGVRKNMLSTFLYHLFKRFPRLEEAAGDASRRIYDEYLMATCVDLQPRPSPEGSLQIIHDDSPEPEEWEEGERLRKPNF
jgi:hypothetical protein